MVQKKCTSCHDRDFYHHCESMDIDSTIHRKATATSPSYPMSHIDTHHSLSNTTLHHQLRKRFSLARSVIPIRIHGNAYTAMLNFSKMNFAVPIVVMLYVRHVHTSTWTTAEISSPMRETVLFDFGWRRTKVDDANFKPPVGPFHPRNSNTVIYGTILLVIVN